MKNTRAAVYLNVGCGLDAPPEWLNIDASPTLRLCAIPFVGPLIRTVLKAPRWPSNAVYGDVVKGLPLAPGSCALVFASHVLEHLSLADFHAAVKNLHAYLRPGGTLRIIVPDLEAEARGYLLSLQDKSFPLPAVELMKKLNLGCEGKRGGFFRRMKAVFSNSRHQWMWDERTLSEALRSHGFGPIRRRNYGDWSDKIFSLVENKERHQGSICLEAVKPDMT